MLWSTTGRQHIKVTLLTSVSFPAEWPIVWLGSSQTCVLITDFPPRHYTFSHIPICAFRCNLSWKSSLSFGVVFLMTTGIFHTLIVQDLFFFSPPFLITVHLEFTWTRARQAHSPTLLKSVMLPVSAKFGQERLYCSLVLWMLVTWATFNQEWWSVYEGENGQPFISHLKLKAVLHKVTCSLSKRLQYTQNQRTMCLCVQFCCARMRSHAFLKIRSHCTSQAWVFYKQTRLESFEIVWEKFGDTLVWQWYKKKLCSTKNTASFFWFVGSGKFFRGDCILLT